MCGIWAFVGKLYPELYNDFIKLSHRGPDCSTFQTYQNATIGFHRLAIMDPTLKSDQPYILSTNFPEKKTIIFICNGEIYNYQELIQNYCLDIEGHSDCLTIPKLYLKLGFDKWVELFKKTIKGEFAFVLFEFEGFIVTKTIIGRDQIGIRPLYWSFDTTPYIQWESQLYISSEIKAMSSCNKLISEYNPGMISVIDDNFFQYDFKYVYDIQEVFVNENYYLSRIRESFINSVKRRMYADRPIAVALSGGIDSSYVAGVYRLLVGPDIPIYTYCCGMSRGTDIINARKVADHINSIHTEIIFTEEDALSAIPDVIYTIESWDTTSVRASVGQYLLCKYIGTQTNKRILMVGEGPDEVCSSYLFNYNAPSNEELHNCAIDLVKEIIYYDVKRADRCISRWGLEGRVSGLDPEFIESYWELPAEYRHPKYKGIEKWWFRKSMEDLNIVPNEIVWRKKEAFSDGVSSKERSWFQIIQEFVNKQVSDEEFNLSDCPTKEAYYYKKIFIEKFGENRLNIIPHYWQPRWTGLEGYIDPSARVLNVYE